MNICELKLKSTYVPAGRIMPAWVVKIVKGNKRQSHRIKSNGCYIFRMPAGGFLVYSAEDSNPGIKINSVSRVEICFNPYGGRFGAAITSSHGFALQMAADASAQAFKCRSKTRVC